MKRPCGICVYLQGSSRTAPTLTLLFSLFFILQANVAEAANKAEWQASVQSGFGQAHVYWGALVRPRLQGSGRLGSLALSIPLMFNFSNNEPGSPGVMLNRWSDPETYAGILETYDGVFFKDQLRLHAGALTQESFHYGSLIEQYTGRLDFLRSKSGLRMDGKFAHGGTTFMIDSIVAPRLLGFAGEISPLSAAGKDPNHRLRLIGSLAADAHAPSLQGDRALWGGEGGLGVAVFKSQRHTVEFFGLGAGLFGMGGGGHLGVKWTFEQAKPIDRVTLQLEYVLSGDGYVPGYFSMAYASDRVQRAGYAGLSQRDVEVPGGHWARWQFDLRAGRFRTGLLGSVKVGDYGTMALYAAWVEPKWQVRALWLKRHIENAAGVFNLDDATGAQLEASYAFDSGMFLFTMLSQTWRLAHVDSDMVIARDWILGAGYAFGG